MSKNNLQWTSFCIVVFSEHLIPSLENPGAQVELDHGVLRTGAVHGKSGQINQGAESHWNRYVTVVVQILCKSLVMCWTPVVCVQVCIQAITPWASLSPCLKTGNWSRATSTRNTSTSADPSGHWWDTREQRSFHVYVHVYKNFFFFMFFFPSRKCLHRKTWIFRNPIRFLISDCILINFICPYQRP